MFRHAKELGNAVGAGGAPAPRWRAPGLLRAELATVRSQTRLARRRALRTLALTLNHLGNGWLYPVLAVALACYDPHEFLALAGTTLLAAGAAHSVYPWIKRLVARPRPFEVDPEMPALLRPLDRYSFPSGHTMTATVVAIPVSAAHPALLAPAALACLAIAWARLVAGHHYPSDILAGAALGAAISLPVTLAFL